jgi:diguanylate cyclase (GGDEF)-like protein
MSGIHETTGDNGRDLPPELVQQVEAERLAAWIRLSYGTIVVGIAIFVALEFAFWQHRRNIVFQASGFSILALYFCLVIVGRGWLKLPNRIFYYKKYIIVLGILRFFIGLSWALLLHIGMVVGDQSQQNLMCGIGIALMSTTLFGGSILFALTFWLPITAGFFIALLSLHGTQDIVNVICLCGYAVLTLISILTLCRKTLEMGLNAVRLARSNEAVGILLREYEEHSSDWLWETDASLLLQQPSKRFISVAGQRNLRINFMELFLQPLAPAEALAEQNAVVKLLSECLTQRQPFRDLVVPLNIRGKLRFWSLSGKPILNKDGTFNGFLGKGSDVTEVHEFRERNAYLASHDVLTGLCNRTQFSDALADACKKLPGQAFTIITIDLDRFKLVNDSHGHAVGDDLLAAAASRIRSCIRDSDIAARLGGDEFCVLLREEGSTAARATEVPPAEARRIAGRILEQLLAPFQIRGFTIEIGASAGVASGPTDGCTAEALLQHADFALFQAKSDGRGVWRDFGADLLDKAKRRVAIEHDLRRAVDLDQMSLYYQPIVSLDTQGITGAEALLRWRHPDHGLLTPADFMEIAETTGLIQPIGDWVISEACRLTRELPRMMRIAVNLSPIQLRDTRFLGRVVKILQSSGASPAQLEFEITETAALDLTKQSRDMLLEFRRMGMKLTLDDFGTGYSSLSLLRMFRFDRIKIDQSFVRDLISNGDDQILVEQIITLAQKLKIEVSVEGIENDAQLEFFRQFTGLEGQGYLFARADTAAYLNRWLLAEHGSSLSSSALTVSE